MDSDSLNSISLSGIISQFINLQEEESLVKVGPPEPSLVYQLTPVTELENSFITSFRGLG